MLQCYFRLWGRPNRTSTRNRGLGATTEALLERIGKVLAKMQEIIYRSWLGAISRPEEEIRRNTHTGDKTGCQYRPRERIVLIFGIGAHLFT